MTEINNKSINDIAPITSQNNNIENEMNLHNRNNINLNLIKNALLKLKNEKKENLIKKYDINNDNKSRVEIKLLNNKSSKFEQNEEDIKINLLDKNTQNGKDDFKGNLAEKKEININEEIDLDENDLDNNKDEEENEDLYSISSNCISDTSLNSKDKDKIINIYRRRKENESTIKKKVINYRKSNKGTVLKRKKYYVHQLLQRWWYSLPMWPPENFDTSNKLRENNLRLVDEENWKKEAEINSDNFKKCIELPGYKYVYLSIDGKIYDFRPEEGKPTFNNLMKLNDIELHQHIVDALKNQLDELEKRNFPSEKKFRSSLRNELKIAKWNLSHIKGKK